MDAVVIRAGFGSAVRRIDGNTIIGEHIGAGVLVRCRLCVGKDAVGTDLGLAVLPGLTHTVIAGSQLFGIGHHRLGSTILFKTCRNLLRSIPLQGHTVNTAHHLGRFLVHDPPLGVVRVLDIVLRYSKIDGVPTSEMTRESVHNLFSMVLQDTWLFEGTVRENLVYNKTGVTDQQLEAACRACGIYHFIETLPQGFDTVLDSGIAISAGQKQLLTIARAMIQDNPMLILDEATSSVDTQTELITQKAMDRLTEHRTSFVIAHRLSTIKNADLILVLKDGDIIEQGTHNQLLAKGGFYADLYNSQFEKVS